MNLKILRYVFCTDVDVRNVLFGVTTFRTTQGKSKLSYKLLVVTSGPLIYVFSSRNFLNELGEILVLCKAPILDLLGLVYPLPIFLAKKRKVSHLLKCTYFLSNVAFRVLANSYHII